METILNAVANGDEKTLRQWVTPTNVNEKGNGGWTALHVASYNGCQELSQYLLSLGAHVNCTNAYKTTPLHQAVANGHIELVRLLLGAGALANVLNTNEFTPLWYAVEQKHSAIAYMLLEAGADLSLLRETNIPQYAIDYAALVKMRPVIRSSCLTLVMILKRQNIPRDIIRILVKLVWDSRFTVDTWVK